MHSVSITLFQELNDSALQTRVTKVKESLLIFFLLTAVSCGKPSKSSDCVAPVDEPTELYPEEPIERQEVAELSARLIEYKFLAKERSLTKQERKDRRKVEDMLYKIVTH